MNSFETISPHRPDSHQLSAFVSTKWSAQRATLGDSKYAAEQLAEHRAEQAALCDSEYTAERLAAHRAQQSAFDDSQRSAEQSAVVHSECTAE